jgi:hypothetical protein
MKRPVIKALLIATMLLISTSAFAKNPIFDYFSKFLDETKAEIAIGKMMEEAFIKAIAPNTPAANNTELQARVKAFAINSPRPELQYKVMQIESNTVDAFPFPGGTIFITTGLVNSIKDQRQLDFILARNIMHIALRHPMKLIKQKGLYPGFLTLIKKNPEKRDQKFTLNLIRDYIRYLPHMNQEKADLQGILLTKSPEQTRLAALKLLNGISQVIWPVTPWDRGDLSTRIQKLEALKLPE